MNIKKYINFYLDESFFKKLARVKKRQIAKKAIGLGAAAWAFKFGAMNSDPPPTRVDSGQYTQRLEAQYLYQKTETVDDDEQSLTESQSVNSIRFKTGSGAVVDIRNQQNQKNGKTPMEINVSSVEPSEALKSALEVRSGDLGKSGPGPRAKADARLNSNTISSSIFVDCFVPQKTYCQHHKSDPPLSCKSIVKVSDNPFQDDGNNNNPPPEDGQFDASQYKGGPSPFKEYEYGDPATVAQNIGFNQPKRLNKSYDKHAEDCFGITGNRNKENLEIFKGDIQNLAQSADEVYKGSYRYKDSAYIFLKEIDEKMTAVIVNPTDGEYITSINPTDGQMEDIESNGNIGLDTRPSMQLTLRLRGPKGQN
jgi:hypothetical protein